VFHKGKEVCSGEAGMTELPLCVSPCKGENLNPLLTKEGAGEVDPLRF